MNRFWHFIILILFIISCSAPPPERNWVSIQKDLQTQFITIEDSSVINLPEGHFMFSKALLLDGKNNVTIKGAGVDKTILSFADQLEGAEGMKISNSTNITMEGFTVEDAVGDNIKVTDTKGLTLRKIKSHWTGKPDEKNGAYAFYPVLSKNVLIENCIAIGASDAGIYVGQSDSVIIRNNEVYHNVAGIESENSKFVEIYGNVAHDNTGGILVFDLPGLTQFGHTTRVYQNNVYENNFRNFAPAGNIVATVPPGTGIMLLATRNIEIFENTIEDNRTVGLAIVSYKLVEGLSTKNASQINQNIETAKTDEAYDPYPNQIFIHHNSFENSFMFPTLKNDFGLLFLTKFPFSTPDIAWGGIRDPENPFEMCLNENGNINFGNIDAGNDFENLTSDWSEFICERDPIAPIF